MNESIGMFAYNIPFASIFLMMISAIITPLLPDKNRIPEKLSCVMIGIVGVLSAYLLYALTAGGQSLSFNFMMGHFPAPWGNELRAGPLEAVLSLVFCAAMLLSLTGNLSSTAEDIAPKRRNIFCVLVNLLTASLLALTYTNDLFTAYVFIEINTIAACAIVAVKESPETVRAALRYLIMSLVGSGLVMIAICLLYDLTGHLLMQDMSRAIHGLVASKSYIMPLTVSLALITAGLAIKSALYPFASWLPDAHGSSTNASSAILSGLVLKGHIFTIIKIFHRVYGLDVIHLLRMDTVIFILGLVAMIMGSVHALRQTNVKRMIAWSSVAQVGYIFLGVGLNTTAGIAAACLHIIVHACVKPMLFTAAGGLSNAAGHKKGLHALMGTFYVNIWAGLGLIAGAFSMMGIPGFAGFASKLSLTLASFGHSTVVWALSALAASSVLNALYYVPAVIVVLTHNKDAQKNFTAHAPTMSYKVSMCIFLALNFYLGLFCMPLLRLITRGVSVL
ncbi:MAG: hypothetical protein IJP89_11725 [Synergistaceae bacterium]|nr:hypothetical protein [Synergistaceae bacterium]